MSAFSTHYKNKHMFGFNFYFIFNFLGNVNSNYCTTTFLFLFSYNTTSFYTRKGFPNVNRRVT